MANEKPVPDSKLLAKLHPLDTIAAEHLATLVEHCETVTLKLGEVVFEAGDATPVLFYVLEGELKCIHPTRSDFSIASGSDAALRPVSNLIPRQFTARIASETATIMTIDREVVEKAQAWSQMAETDSNAAVEVTDLSGGSETTREWMFGLLQSPIFKELPTASIEQFFARIERVDAKADDVIIKQGEAGDYYYMLAHGVAEVLRKVGPTQLPIAELECGDAFGEEALIAGTPRNASVRMKTDGTLMRLSAEDFKGLLEHPLVRWVTPKEAAAAAKSGAQLLDVRTEREHGVKCIRGSMNIPLYKLRKHSDTLDRNAEYIVYCDTGARSSAAAFLLGERGFKSAAIQGGLSAMLR